jgi:hypothetical protein
MFHLPYNKVERDRRLKDEYPPSRLATLIRPDMKKFMKDIFQESCSSHMSAGDNLILLQLWVET